MRAVVLAAGLGRRLGPLTLTRPKPLLHVAGRPILAHILDSLTRAGITDVVVVVGYLREQIAAYLETRPEPRPRAVVQSPLGGNGDAVRAARAYLDGPVLVAFGDTILLADLTKASRSKVAAIAVARVDDGRSYGIVEADSEGWVRRLWEKPAVPPSHDAVAGTFIFPEGQRLRDALDEMAAGTAGGTAGRNGSSSLASGDPDLGGAGASPSGEMWLTDAVQRMIDRGERVRTLRVEAFYDCGTPQRLAEADAALRAVERAAPPHPDPFGPRGSGA